MHDKNDGIVNNFASYAAELGFDDIPEKTVLAAKKVLLDFYGNLIYGRYRTRDRRISMLLQQLSSNDSKGQRIIGAGKERFGLSDVIFLHSMMARSSDLDDGYSAAMGHPGSVLCPLALALSIYCKRSGKELLTALIMAYNIYYHLATVLNPYMYREKGFDATGVVGAVAGAALSGKLMGESEKEIKSSMGLASLVTGGLTEYQNDGSSGKYFCGAWGGTTALRAALLAKIGYTGPEKAFEGKKGFFQGFMGTSGRINMENALSGLWTENRIEDVYFKRYACMRGLHATLDGIRSLRNRFDIKFETISSVKIATSNFVLRLSNPSPTTVVGAQNSLQFAVALLLKYGYMDSESIVSQNLFDEEIRRFAKEIKVCHDEEVEKYTTEHPSHFGASKITIVLKNGEAHTIFSTVPEGDVGCSFDWNTLVNKFERMISGTPFESEKEEWSDYIMHFESVPVVDNYLLIP